MSRSTAEILAELDRVSADKDVAKKVYRDLVAREIELRRELLKGDKGGK